MGPPPAIREIADQTLDLQPVVKYKVAKLHVFGLDPSRHCDSSPPTERQGGTTAFAIKLA
jgi:hypothetical protein